MNVALIITTYNRPEYLSQCLNSLHAAIAQANSVYIIDDASTDEETIRLINEFPAVLYRKPQNKGIKDSLLTGCDLAFNTADLVINIDGDAIVKSDFINRLVELKRQHPQNIISGFNSANRNKDGSLRNPIISEHDGYALKKHGNGINMCFNKDDYNKTIRPSLQKDGNWDYNSTSDKPFVISVPSLVQHIGINSSMGHNQEPDVACDFKLLNLPDVTLFGIDAFDPSGIERAAQICLQNIDFGAVKIITERLFIGREGYSKFCIKDMARYIDTSHVLLIHADGYIQNASAWRDEWLQYDYIGATWWYKDGMNVGNGGFSLRSKKLLDILAGLDLDNYHPEDDIICRQLRPWLEKQGIKFAPAEVADRFSIEAYSVHAPYNSYCGQFGFHGYHVTGLPIPLERKQGKKQRR